MSDAALTMATMYGFGVGNEGYMPEITSFGAVNRHITEYLTDNPRVKQYKCKTLQNPDYYYNDSVFAPVDVAFKKDTSTDKAGGIWLRDKAIVSVGTKKDDDSYKLFGLRPDENQSGSESLEVSIESIEINGKPQVINLRDRLEVSPITTCFGGNLYIQRARQRCRVMVLCDNTTEDFKIALRLHLKPGMSIVYRPDLDEYWTYRNGVFFVRLSSPYLVDLATMNPLRPDDFGSYPQLVKHSLIEISKGEYRYIKEPTEAFGKVTLPASFLIDADTIYSSTSDGYVAYTDTGGWTATRNGTTGVSAVSNGTDSPNAITAYESGGTYVIYRSFFYYSLTGLSGTVTATTENIYGSSNAESNVSSQKGTQATPLTTADYDSFSGSAYCNTAAWTTSNYNVLTYGEGGLSDVQAALEGTHLSCLREYSKDYSNSTPVGLFRNGCKYSEDTSGTSDPYLYITTEAAAAGQPTIKRFGGIPFARSMSAQGVTVW